MSVITFASSKGGVGKTTSAIILGTILARHSRVIMLDTDPIQTLSTWFDLAPVSGQLKVVAPPTDRGFIGALDRARETSDHVIVDTQGAARSLTAMAMGESDLVIIPMGDEYADAKQAIDTLAALRDEAGRRKREIPVRILFTRTKAAVKSRIQKSVNEQVRNNIGAFTTELAERTAYASLHGHGGSLYDLDREEVSGVDKAIGNAELFADEVRTVLGWVDDIRGWGRPDTQEMNHGA